jgi:hypothetical protein
MAYRIEAGVQVSLDGVTWYKLTDHNRSKIQVNPTLIESQQRMANGTMRKYVIAKKTTISTSWEMIPSKSSMTVDANRSSAWLDSFYMANAGIPIKVKIVSSGNTDVEAGNYPSDTTFQSALTKYDVYSVYITKYSSTVRHRNVTGDYVDMEIEFTEI